MPMYLDLANEAWEVVETTRHGWNVVPDPPVKSYPPRGTSGRYRFQHEVALSTHSGASSTSPTTTPGLSSKGSIVGMLRPKAT